MRVRLSFAKRVLSCLGVAFASLLTSGRSLAIERQWHVGPDVGFALLNRGGGQPGLGAGAHAAYGLSDAFNGLVELNFSHHGFGSSSAKTDLLTGALGAAYTLDVTRLVPYGGILIGGYRLFGDVPATGLGVQLAAGLDYEVSPSFGLGLQVRWHEVPVVDRGDSFSYLTVFARAEYLWGF